MLRVGIIGAGAISAMHIKAYKSNPRCALSAIADLNGELAATFSSDTAGVSDANFLGLGFYFRSKMADPFEFVIDDVYLGVVSAS